LEGSGVRIIQRYLPDIHLLFKAADVYISPVRSSSGTIEQPLSLIEALAVGLPVVAFPVGGIPDLATTYGGVSLATSPEEALLLLERARRGELPIPDRTPPDWLTVTDNLLREAEATVRAYYGSA